MDLILSSIKQISTIRIVDVIDILIVTLLFYNIFLLIRKTKTLKIFLGIVLLLFALWFSGVAQLNTVNFLLRNTVQIGLIALVVLFQPEIRRFLERLVNNQMLNIFVGNRNVQLVSDTAITQTVLACTDMSATRTGALIIFERENNLDDQIRTGTIINADPSAELLKNIFYPKAPLHDGAVIIRDGRIQAGGCMLPLSNNPNLSRDLGMRHRAGIGMSEASDAVVIIVSEETGAISVAVNGMLKRHLSKETFEKILRNELSRQEEDVGPWWTRLFRGEWKGSTNE